jgi:UDPglucose 6-dehydrogenase
MSGTIIGFAGMTHLGIVSASAAAARGFNVVCYDPSVERIAALTARQMPVFEPGLEDACRTHASRMSLTSDPADLDACDVVYVAPDVPTDDSDGSDLRTIKSLASLVVARPAAFTVVVLSQVPPGFTRALERRHHPLHYQVETLVFGNALERAIKPERFIVGCADPAEPLPKAYGEFLQSFGCPILPMRYESAELAKIAINCCLVAMVSTANTLAEICEQIGADWSEIVPALRLDRRIGEYSYLQPGLGLAGGNLERDLATVRQLGTRLGTDAGVVSAWVANSAHRRHWPLRLLQEAGLATKPHANIGVMGLAYKQDTHSIKNSAAVALIDGLTQAKIRAYDPVVAAEAVRRPNLVRVAEPMQAADDAQAVALMTPWPIFRDIDPAALAKRMSGKTVIDPYGLLDSAACRQVGLVHHRLGVFQ